MPQVALNGRRVQAAFIILGQLQAIFVNFDGFGLLLTFSPVTWVLIGGCLDTCFSSFRDTLLRYVLEHTVEHCHGTLLAASRVNTSVMIYDCDRSLKQEHDHDDPRHIVPRKPPVYFTSMGRMWDSGSASAFSSQPVRTLPPYPHAIKVVLRLTCVNTAQITLFFHHS